MIIYNITFVIDPKAEQEFVGWIKKIALPVLNIGSSAPGRKLLKVVEAGHKKPEPEDGLSMALHVGFASEQNARNWYDRMLPAVLRAFVARFGPHAGFFSTMLKEVELDQVDNDDRHSDNKA